MDTGGSKVETSQNASKQRLVAEVLELGESLFETALEARSQQPAKDEGEGDKYPIDELRAAAQEFFSALRLLLRMEV